MTVNDLAQELLDVALDQEPLQASLVGYPGYDDRLADPSAEAQEGLAQRFADIARRADAVAADGLSEIDRQTLDFVRHMAAVSRDATRVPLIEFTITDLYTSPASALANFLPQVPVTNDEQRAAYRERLRTVPAVLQATAQRHREGVENRRPAVASLARHAVEHLDRMLADASLAGITRSDDDAVIVEDVVRPAFVAYRDAIAALADTGRDDEHVGLGHLAGGLEWYDALIRQHTGTTRSPEELHQTGLAVTRSLFDEYAEIGGRHFGVGEPPEIFRRLRTDEDLRYGSRQQMLDEARAAITRAEAAAPQWFGVLPSSRCVVEAVPATHEAGAPGAYYLVGAMDGSRPGTYYLNTRDPQSTYRHTSEATAFHEAVPGHHFQCTIMQELEELPMARRMMEDTAYVEGWGLYSERLAHEMGLYSDDVSLLGMLSLDSMRAGRLVVDTGMHALGWSRADAIEWLTTNTPMPPIEIASEVDRYIATPGQALAYMVGRLELVDIRARVENALGPAFDLRAFHDSVLRTGGLPLSVLSDAADRWLAASTA